MVQVIDKIEGATFDFDKNFANVSSHHPHKRELQSDAEAEQGYNGQPTLDEVRFTASQEIGCDKSVNPD
jgi:hypothetical protein